MIQSMTAFTRHEARNDTGTATWELRSINHRYLEINLRLPENFTALDFFLREQIKMRMQRGKCDVTLRYQPAAMSANKLNINKTVISQLLNSCNEIAAEYQLPATPPSALTVLQWPGVLQTQETPQENLTDLLKNSFLQALDELVVARQREGNALQKFIEQRLQAIQSEIDKVKIFLPQIMKTHREKLLQRLHEINANVDPVRLEQELVFFAQKTDVAEEIDRLATHCQEMHRTLQQNEPVGRRLDFLLQETNREANTLASKSVTNETTMIAVELKVLIEQIREQVQNIE
jgi:uncharacterized protein (TIGR00255 family)